MGSARIVLTLFNKEGQVAGFRVASIGAGFESGETRMITIEVVSQADEDRLVSYQLHAEGRLR